MDRVSRMQIGRRVFNLLFIQRDVEIIVVVVVQMIVAGVEVAETVEGTVEVGEEAEVEAVTNNEPSLKKQDKPRLICRNSTTKKSALK